MNIAIEFGGAEFRSMRREAGRLLSRQVSTEYLVLENSTETKRLLERHGEEVIPCDQGILVLGTAANDLAQMLSLPMQSALNAGAIRENDPVSRQFLGALVESIVPLAHSKESSCTVISSLFATHQMEQPSLDFLLRLIKLQGHEPHVISPGAAMVLSECGEVGFSGIAVNMGTACVDISIVHQTREKTRVVLPRGGLHIDHQLAISEHQFVRLKDGREVLDTRPIRLWRESVENLNSVSDSKTLQLRDQYRKLIRQALQLLQQQLTPSLLSQLPGVLPIIFGGPLAAPSGLEILFQEAINELELPIQIESVNKASDVASSVLRGGLIAGELGHPESLSAFAA